jgi:hypothetical protein
MSTPSRRKVREAEEEKKRENKLGQSCAKLRLS